MKTAKMTVTQVADILKDQTLSPEVIQEIEKDPRISVAKLLIKWQSNKQKSNLETDRLAKLYQYERSLQSQGYSFVAGIDEAGRGPLAGPVTVGCVILPLGCHLPRLNDSKKLTPGQREELYHLIKQKAISVSSAVIDVDIIDRVNIYQATRLGMYSVIDQMTHTPDAVLIDAVPLPELTMFSKSLIGGDALSASIAAASIIAKVERDRIMDSLALQYPEYGFDQHKGYATPEHLQAIHKYGPCLIHRTTFEPIKSWGRRHEHDTP